MFMVERPNFRFRVSIVAHPFLEFPGLCCPNVGLPTKSDEINIIVIAVVGLLIVIILVGVIVVLIISSSSYRRHHPRRPHLRRVHHHPRRPHLRRPRSDPDLTLMFSLIEST